MKRLKAVFRGNRRGYDSDSTGYFSSSSDRPLTRSQFILCAADSGPNYDQDEYLAFPSTSCSSSGCESMIYSDTSYVRKYRKGPLIQQRRYSSRPSLQLLFPETLEYDDSECNQFPSFTEIDYCQLDEHQATIKKKLQIKEVESKIYFDERLPCTKIPQTDSMPRSILKKPLLSNDNDAHIYEEIDDSDTEPYPDDIRPEIPARPQVLPNFTPNGSVFVPKTDKRDYRFPLPNSKRRKKLPSLYRPSSHPDISSPSISCARKFEIYV